MARAKFTKRTHFGGPTQTKLNASVPPNEPISTAKRLAAFGERRTEPVGSGLFQSFCWRQCRVDPLVRGWPPARLGVARRVRGWPGSLACGRPPADLYDRTHYHAFMCLTAEAASPKM